MARDNRATAVIFASVLCITNSATDSAEFRIFADAGSVVLGITDFFAETRGSLWSLECEAQHTSGTVAVFSYPATSTADDEAPRIENICFSRGLTCGTLFSLDARPEMYDFNTALEQLHEGRCSLVASSPGDRSVLGRTRLSAAPHQARAPHAAPAIGAARGVTPGGGASRLSRAAQTRPRAAPRPLSQTQATASSPPSTASPEWQSEAFSWVQRLVAGGPGGGAASRPSGLSAPSLGDDGGPFEQWERTFGGLPHLPTHPDPEQVQQQLHGGARPSLVRRMLTSAGTAELVAAATTGAWAGTLPAEPGLAMRSNTTRTDSWPSPAVASSSIVGPSHRAVRSAAKRELARRWGDMLAYDRSPHGRLYDEADHWLLQGDGGGGGNGAPSEAAAAEPLPSSASADPATVRAAALLETVARVFEGGQHRGRRGREGAAEGGSGAPSPELGYGAWKRERDTAVASAASTPAALGDAPPLPADDRSSDNSGIAPDLSSLLLDLSSEVARPHSRFSAGWHSLVRQQPEAGQAATSPDTRPHGGHTTRRHSVVAAPQRPAATGATNHRVRFLRRKESEAAAEAQAQLATMLVEAHAQVSSLLEAGVRSKEIFAMVVNQIMNKMPEIILQIVISTVREPITQLVAFILSVLLPPLLVPASGAIKMIVVPGKALPHPPPPAPPPLPCVCKSESGEEEARFRQRSSLGASAQGAARCGCPPAPPSLATAGHPAALQQRSLHAATADHPTPAAAAAPPLSLMEAGAIVQPAAPGTAGAGAGADSEALADAEADAWTRVSAYGGEEEGVRVGATGPIAHIEPKVKKFVRDQLKTEALPRLRQALIERIKSPLIPMCANAMHRDLSRKLIQAVTTMIVSKLHASLQEAIGAPLIRANVRELTEDLTGRLAPALSSAIAHSLANSPATDYFCALCKALKGKSEAVPGYAPPPAPPTSPVVPGSRGVGQPLEATLAAGAGPYCGACAHAKEWDRRLDERIAEVSPRYVKEYVARALA